MIPRIQVDDEADDDIRRTPLWKRPKVLIIAAAVVIGLVLLFSKNNNQQRRPGEAAKEKDAFIGVVIPYEAAREVVTKVATGNPVPAPRPPHVPTTPPSTPPVPVPAAVPKQPAPLPPSMREVMNTPSKETHSRMLVYAVPPPDKVPAAPADPAETSLTFKTASIPGTKASPAIDETYMLMPGLLPMVLDSAIQSDLPGPLLAHLPGPVYSPKGVLLMEAGTQVIGKYETMGKSGSRLMANSVYAHTPKGIWVPLSGEPLADDLGRSGLDGEINNHYLQRFGGAVLLTLTDQFLQILQAEASKGNNTYLNFNSGGGGSGIGGLAQQILQSQINIPATFSKHQGETIALFLDEPIDFSASYRIHTVRVQQ